MNYSQPWIGVDLDGTLAHYDGWKGEDHIGAPIPKMVERVKQWTQEGRRVKIMTARACRPTDAEHEIVCKAINKWCYAHLGFMLEITATKDYGMIELWDDRAVQVTPNTGERADGKD